MIRIYSYAELQTFIVAFGNNQIGLLVVCSKGGLGKSELVRRTLDFRKVVFVGGHMAPLGFYRVLFLGRDMLVVIDEIDGLFANPGNVGLVKQVGETTEIKRVQWISTDRRADAIDGGKGYFKTRSHVLILCNSFSILTANIAALATRATILRFEPSPTEIVSQIASFASDDEIVHFLEEFHAAIPDFNLRTYRKLEEMKAAGLDWRRYAVEELDVPPQIKEIAKLIQEFPTDKDRLEHYSRSRRDFYNWKQDAIAFAEREEIRKGCEGVGRLDIPAV